MNDHPAPHPRPVVDREAINHALNLHWWDEDDQPCVCGFDFLAAGQSFKMHLADVMAALLPTEEGEAECNCYPGGFSPETYEGPQHHCPEHGHGTDLPMSECPTCRHERALAETASKLGEAIGRKAAGDEIAAAFEPALYNSPDGDAFEHTHPKWEGEPECPACWVEAIRQALARVFPQPSGATSEPRTHPNGHTDLPEDAETASKGLPGDGE